MKKLRDTPVLLLMFLSGICFAQKDTTVALQNPAKAKIIYEMGINLYGLTVRAGDYYTQYTNVLDNQIFSGLYFKLFKGKNVLRAALDYSQRSAYYGKQPFSTNSGNSRGQLKSMEIKVGYQRMLGKRRFAPYVFSDLEYNYFWQPAPAQQDFYPMYSSYSYNYIYYRYYTLSGSFFCVTPGFGLRWNIAKCVVLNFETGAQFFYSHERSSNNFEPNHFKSAGINAKPAKVSIGFTF